MSTTIEVPAVESLPAFTTKRIAEYVLTRSASYAAVAPDQQRWTNMDGGPEGAAKFMTPYAAKEVNEVSWVLPLNTQQKLIGNAPIVVGRGSIESVSADPREVFTALMAAKAHSFVFLHNHPDDNEDASEADKAVARRLAALGEIAGIKLLDALVITASGRFTSMVVKYPEVMNLRKEIRSSDPVKQLLDLLGKGLS